MKKHLDHLPPVEQETGDFGGLHEAVEVHGRVVGEVRQQRHDGDFDQPMEYSAFLNSKAAIATKTGAA